MDTHTPASPSPLRIDGEMTIYRAAELRMLLSDALAKTGDIELQLDAVTEIDSTGVQLLMSAKKTAREKQQALHIVGYSPEVLEVFGSLGLAPHLDDVPSSTQPSHDGERSIAAPQIFGNRA
ncbi:protein of unknown function [Burkholderia multivorans]